MQTMSISIENSGIISRLQLARALKEDPDNPNNDPPENSAIFLRQRARNSPTPTGQFYIPHPESLLTPPILSKLESSPNDSQPIQSITTNGSTCLEDRRNLNPGKPATLLDVRKSMLDTRQSIHNMLPFSPASSHRTSLILQQHRSLPDLSTTAKQSHGTSRLSNVSTNNSRSNSPATNSSRPNSSHNPSRPTSFYNPSSRPTSSYNISSRPTSMFKTFTPQDSEDDSSSESEVHKKRSQVRSKVNPVKSKKMIPLKSKNKKVVSSSSESSDSSKEKNKSLSKSKLEKVEEEDSNDSEESMDEEDEDSDESESEDDTPLALKVTPKIKVASPNGIVKKNGKRIEAWLDTVSGSEPEINARNLRPPSAYSPTTSSPLRPLGFGHRLSPTPESTQNRRPRSSTENLYISEPQSQQRKRANSEFVPKRNSYMPEKLSPQFVQVGRVSPSLRQDSGYWARDTLVALSDDFRHLSLINDTSSYSISSSNSQSKSDGSSNLLKHRENSSLSSFGSRPHSPHVPSPTLRYSRSRDSLYATNNRQSYYMTNNITRPISSEHLPIAENNNRVSYYPSQQKYRVR